MLFGTLKYVIVNLVFFMSIYLDIDGLHYIYTMYYICCFFFMLILRQNLDFFFE